MREAALAIKRTRLREAKEKRSRVADELAQLITEIEAEERTKPKTKTKAKATMKKEAETEVEAEEEEEEEEEPENKRGNEEDGDVSMEESSDEQQEGQHAATAATVASPTAPDLTNDADEEHVAKAVVDATPAQERRQTPQPAPALQQPPPATPRIPWIQLASMRNGVAVLAVQERAIARATQLAKQDLWAPTVARAR
jgi:hypothetical protein